MENVILISSKSKVHSLCFAVQFNFEEWAHELFEHENGQNECICKLHNYPGALQYKYTDAESDFTEHVFHARGSSKVMFQSKEYKRE